MAGAVSCATVEISGRYISSPSTFADSGENVATANVPR